MLSSEKMQRDCAPPAVNILLDWNLPFMATNAESRADFEQIAALETRAEKLKDLLEQRSAKRPLIIEFSGAPKAGKTRSINGLELFLKRNGIKVEVFTERASIAPIKSKGHLNFNVWVSCASLQGMLEALYRDLDVFILDRGVFDALVWNEWLEMTGKITGEEARQVAEFFTMKRWTELIDLIFVLTCEPKVSIEREYADQLTTKRGTIMAEETLKQFLRATDETMKEHGTKFKRIVPIDTTSTKTRQGVAKITDEALNVLNEFLDESIGVVPVDAVRVALPESGFVSDTQTISGFVDTFKREKAFLPRSQAEQNANYLQAIPCAVLRYDDKILLLKRKKPGHPLHDTYAVWAGGHVIQTDDGDDILLNTLHRELTEELFIKEAFELNPSPVGLIRTNEDARASRHIAVLYEIALKSENVALALNQKEFRSTRGSSMSGRLVQIGEMGAIYDDMGDWSKFIVEHFWPEQVPTNKQQARLFGS
jgi:predicted NUDIX family phosphoesterase/thymidylate kinase